MGLKETWVDRIDGVDDADAEDINMVARAVIAIEEANGDIDEALDRIIAIQNELLGIIIFTYNGTEYNAIEGMTWGEWVDSEYNTANAVVGGMYNNMIIIDGVMVLDPNNSYNPVAPFDVITQAAYVGV
jgi:hypothetical protein